MSTDIIAESMIAYNRWRPVLERRCPRCKALRLIRAPHRCNWWATCLTCGATITEAKG